MSAFLKLRNAAGTRSRFFEKERDRNATTKITRNARGTHAFLLRSFSLEFSALKLKKPTENPNLADVKSFLIFSNLKNFKFLHHNEIWEDNMKLKIFAKISLDRWQYIGISNIRKGTQKERKKERAFLLWKRNGAGARSRFSEKERDRNAFLKFEERPMPWKTDATLHML